MITKIFGGKKIQIRKLSKKDLRNVKKFQDFINSLIEEEAQITLNKRLSFREEAEFMKEKFKNIKRHKVILLVAEDKNMVVGTTEIKLSGRRHEHVGNLGITIRQGYRGIGLGKYLMAEVLKLAKKELKPKPKIIRLSVFPTNKPAIRLYKKFGFREVAKIPKQIRYKGKLIDEIVMLKEL